MGGEGLDAERARERRDPVLRRPDPLTADLDDLPAADLLVEDPPANAVERLEHDDRATGGHELARRHEAGEPGSDDEEVGVGPRARRIALKGGRRHPPYHTRRGQRRQVLGAYFSGS